MLELKATQKATLSVVFRDAKGNPAKVDGVPSWGVDAPALAALAVSDDGLSCVVSAVGPLGTALVSVQADADLGEGVKAVAGTLEVTVTAGDATVVEIATGDVSEQ